MTPCEELVFKVGDKVQCVDASFTSKELKIGQIYTVRYTDDDGFISVLDDDSLLYGQWSAGRFVLVEEKQKQKRIKQKPETRKKTDLTLVYKDLSQHTFKNVQAVNETEQYLTVTCTKEIAEGISEVTNTYIDKSIALSFLMEKPAGEYVLKDLHKAGKKEFSGGVKILF